ncbi:hypothetical protein E4U19_005198 [Claviceps sp. Clav32 group G5]|nr:hypothetical protein E4U19_005198 [Claviceps sp. Clav32 group G5]KAG6037277.1 hypothetical protein E4U40_006266 [Claviceps sp. LM458 group G5]KAG6047433.1 hypothetical protein E4U39_000486 [Claviceps sp. Clav50 group G5]
MKLSVFSLLASALALARAEPLGDEDADKDVAASTVFNSKTVPPLLELTATNWNDEVNKTKWLLVKNYSPYCGHCKYFAPIYQTLYEFYYTSDTKDGSSFEKFYDFRFATLDCTMHADLCNEHNVLSFPTTSLYKNGQLFDEVLGAKSLKFVSKMIEKGLDNEKPGSRPEAIELPEVGAKEFPTPDASKSAGESPAKTGDTSADDKTEKKSTTESAKKVADEEAADKAFGKGWKVPTAGELEKERKPKQPAVTPNTDGVSIDLTAETFQKRVTQTQDAWFIKFYAPWCHHCQAMGPTWQQLAKTMRTKLNIGEVNCDKEPRLCKDVRANSYPTIIFFKGAERADYNGLRGLGDFVQFAEKAVDLASGVPDVNATSFQALEEKEDVIFVYFYDHATTSEDFRALERIPLSLVGHAKLVKTNDPKLYKRFKITTWPRLLVSREGRPTYFPPITPDEMRDKNGVLDWMRSVWLPLVPELTPANARQIFNGKIVVLGILSHADKVAFSGSLREMKSAANEWMDRQIQEFQLERKKLRDSKQMRIEEAEDRGDQRALRAAKAIRVDMNNSGRKEVGFAWVDGAYWQRWIRQTYGFDVKDGEKIIINDEDNRRYWDQTVTGNYIMVSRTSIMETLDKVVYAPHAIKYKLTVSTIEKILLDIKSAFLEHPYLSLGCVVGMSFGIFSWFRGRSRKAARGGHFRLDDTMGIKDLKEGLLGMNGGTQNTKAD